MIRQIRLLTFFSGIGLCLFCLNPGTCDAEPLKVIASIFPVSDMLSQIGGSEITVITAISPGMSPHTFEPTPGLLRSFSTARLFFMIGAGLEFWADKFIGSSTSKPDIVVLSEGIDMIQDIGHDHETSDTNNRQETSVEHTETHHQSANPHIWLDPVNAQSMARKIIEALSKADQGHAELYAQRGNAYIRELERLDVEIHKQIEAFRIRNYVAFHPAWDYFSRRYGLKCVGVIEASPGRNPTPKQIRQIVQNIRENKIQAVFAEPQFNPKVAEVIANEAGVKVLMLDPMGGPELTGRSNYLELMRYNLNMMNKVMR